MIDTLEDRRGTGLTLLASGPHRDKNYPVHDRDYVQPGARKAAALRETTRRDAWWLQPLVVFGVLGTFVVYATWAAFQGEHYAWGPYLSPFYSPELFGDSPHAWFGPKPDWIPVWLPGLRRF